MANVKVTELTADTSPTSDDLVATVTDPAGTPASRKVTATNLITKAHGLSDGLVKVATGTMAVATAGTDYSTPASTDTLTNKTFDANGTGNSLSNVEVADLASTAVVTAAEGLASSDNDTSLPTTAAVIDGLATKQDTLTGLTSSVAELNILDGATLDVTELNYVDGVTSAIQTQLNAKQASGATLTSLEGLTLGAGDIVYATAADTLTDLAIGTAGQVLTVNAGATAPQWSTPSGGASTVFAEAALLLPNFSMTTGGWASNTNGAGATLGISTEGYLRMQSSTSFASDTLAAYQKTDYSFIDTTYNIFDKDMRITAIIKSIQATNSPSESFFGTVDIVMDNAVDIPFTKTVRHIGIYRTTGSGSSTYTASNANGTTQTSTTFTGPTNEKFASWRIDYIAGTSVKYYLNGTLMATHTTNLPTGAQTISGTSLTVAIGNTGAQVGAAPELAVVSAKLEVEA